MHSEENVKEIAASIQEWGWTTPVLLDDADGIICGHGRVLAAKLLGIVEIPCMVAKGWSDEQKRAYVLADNQIQNNATWDMSLVKLELDDLQDAGFEVGLIGFPGDAEPAAKIKVSGVEVGPVADRFWISVRGPLADQARALVALTEAMKGLRAVEVELGSTAVD